MLFRSPHQAHGWCLLQCAPFRRAAAEDDGCALAGKVFGGFESEPQGCVRDQDALAVHARPREQNGGGGGEEPFVRPFEGGGHCWEGRVSG